MPEISNIREFLKNQTIFLTGGSGFLGKLLIEKILRESPDVQKIYVLMRPKKGKTPEERFEDLFSFACFDRLKAQDLGVLKKVHLVNGDCQVPNLGLSDQDVDILVKETTFVIHAAANVKFDQTLTEATENVRATQDLVELARKMPQLKVFVYVSTAFSNCVHSQIKEEFYEPAMQPENLLPLMELLNEETFEAITPHLLKNYPNTYIFSKSVTEDVIRRAAKDLPITVIRPAIVIVTLKEPIPGWVDNIYGVVGVVLGASLGVIRSLHAKWDARAAIVPADYVVNCILAAAWDRSNSKKSKILNYVGSKTSQLTWKSFMDMIEPHCWNAATDKVLWYYCFKLRQNKLWHQICVFFLHTVQAYVVDFVLFCLKRPPIAVKSYKRLNNSLELISYFSTRSWDFDDHNVVNLWNKMNNEDKRVFCFNMDGLNWNDWGHVSVMGGRQYLLKVENTPETFQKGKRKLKMLFCLHYAAVAVFWFLVYKLVRFFLGTIFNF